MIVNDVIKTVLFRQIMPLLKIPFIMDSCFIPFLNNYVNKKNTKKIQILLELMWEYMPVRIKLIQKA